MAGTTSVSANAPKSEKMRGSSMGVWCQSPSGRLDAGVVPSRARSLSVMYGDGGAEAGPGPQNGAVGVGQAQAAVRGGVAPVATPVVVVKAGAVACEVLGDRKSTRLNSSHRCISYAVFCLKKKKKTTWR